MDPQIDDVFHNYVVHWGVERKDKENLCLFLATNSGPKFKLLHLDYENFQQVHWEFVYALLEQVKEKCDSLKSLQFNRPLFKLGQIDVTRFEKLLPNLKNLEEFIATNGDDDSEELTNIEVKQMSQSVTHILTNNDIVNKLEKLALENVKLNKSSIDQLSHMKLQRFSFRLGARSGHGSIPYLMQNFFTASLMPHLKELKLAFLLLKKYQELLDTTLRHFQILQALESFSLGFQEGKSDECIDARIIAEALKWGFSKLVHLALVSIQYDQMANFETHSFLDNIADNLVHLEIEFKHGHQLDRDNGNLLRSISTPMPNLRSFRVCGQGIINNCIMAPFVAKFCPNLANLVCTDESVPEYLPFVDSLIGKMYDVRRTHMLRYRQKWNQKNLTITTLRHLASDTDTDLNAYKSEGVEFSNSAENFKAVITRNWL